MTKISADVIAKNISDSKIARDFFDEIEKFGINDTIRVKLIYYLATGLESHENTQIVCACIKELYEDKFISK